MNTSFIIHRTFATLAGLVSLIIGILRFYLSSLERVIPASDAWIHIAAGVIFLVCAWLGQGRLMRASNFWLGLFFMSVGFWELNWPHIVLGFIAFLLGFYLRPDAGVVD